MRDITDGTSNTLAIGERGKYGNVNPVNGQRFETCAAVWAGKDNDVALHIVNDEATIGWSLYQMQTGYSNTGLDIPNAAFSSPHEGGVQFLLADGTVRFISENIDWTDGSITVSAQYGTFNKLCHRADGEVVGEF